MSNKNALSPCGVVCVFLPIIYSIYPKGLEKNFQKNGNKVKKLTSMYMLLAKSAVLYSENIQKMKKMVKKLDIAYGSE